MKNDPFRCQNFLKIFAVDGRFSDFDVGERLEQIAKRYPVIVPATFKLVQLRSVGEQQQRITSVRGT